MKTIEFDEESYENYKNAILELEEKRRNLLLELGSSESRLLDNGFPSKNIQIAKEELSNVNKRLSELKSFNAVLKSQKGQSNIITTGNTYRTAITYSDGESVNKTFKLVTAFPNCDVRENEVQRISISSPIGNAINGKEVGGTYKFRVGNETSLITVIEQVNSAEDQLEA